MKNKRLLIIVTFAGIFLLFSRQLNAQNITVDSTPNKYIGVTSNSVHERINLFQYSINLHNPGILEEGWTLQVNINNPVKNNKGDIFNKLDMVKLRVNGSSLVGESPEQPLQWMISNKGVLIIDKNMTANVPLETGSSYYKRIDIGFDVIIDKGKYLSKLQSDSHYSVFFTFTLLDSQGKPLSKPQSAVTSVDIHIHKFDGTDEPEFSYAIEIKGDAPNGLLEFNDINDYVNGVSKRYENGLLITSSTSYAVTVQSLTDNFIAIDASNNNTLPLNTVSLEVQNSINSNILGAVPLSNGSQTIFNMQKEFDDNPRPHPFNIRYFTEPNDERLIKVKPDKYRTTLQYTLVPQ